MKSTLENRIMHKWRATVAALALALAAPVTAFAQNVIQSITASQQAGTDVVRIELSEALAAVPGGFSVQAPPRVAIDLPGVGNGLGKNSVELNQGNLRSANVAQSGERTRLVLNLRQAASYRVQLQGKSLIVLLDSSGPVATASGSPTQFAPAQNDQPLALRDVDFRRGTDSAGRVIVDLPSTQVGVDIRQQGQNLVVEFLRSTLPEKLRRRLDVADFGTPVQSISTFQSGDRVRMVVEPKGSWEHSAYQTDNQFVLEVRPMKVDPNKLVQGPGFSGEKLSLNFQNIEVRALLQVIADFTNFNVVTSDTVTGTVTLRLKDVPWDQALDIILQSKGLGVRKSGNVLWIAPKEELANREQVDLESRKKLAELEPTRTQAFQLNYTKAETIAKSLVGSALVAQAIDNATGQNSGRILSPRGSVIFEQRTNQLFVTDIPSKLEEVQAHDRQDRHPGAPGADRGAHRRGHRQLGAEPGCQARFRRIWPARRHPAQARRWAATMRPWVRRPARARRWTSATRSSSTCRPTRARSVLRPRPLRCRCSAPRRTSSSTSSCRRWKTTATARSSPARASSPPTR